MLAYPWEWALIMLVSFALAVCLSMLLFAFDLALCTKATIFTDSKYARGLLHSSKKPVSNSLIVNVLRSLYKLAASKFVVDVHWVRGHSSIGGNHRVDTIACPYQ